MNDIIKAMEERRSIRKFKADMPSKNDIDQIIEAGLYAASGMGRQNVIIVAITNKQERDRLMKLNAKIMGVDSDPFYGAPAVLLVLVDKAAMTAENDGELVIQNMLLAAHDLGLASCYIWRAKQELETEEGKQMLADWGLPTNVEYEGVGHVILGYADMEAPNPAPRKENYVYRV